MNTDLRAMLRRLAYLGSRHGPTWWVRYSPAFFGVLACAVSGKQRREIRNLLSWVHGRPVSGVETLPSFVAFAHCLAETLGREARPVQIETEGHDVLLDLAKTERGAVVLTAHTGAWELAAASLAETTGTSLVLAMLPEISAQAQALQDRLRCKAGLQIARLGESPLDGVALLDALKQGRFVAFQFDRPSVSGRLLETRLFGRVFQVPLGPFRLAGAAGVPLIPVFSRRTGFLRHRVTIGEPLRLLRHASVEDLRLAAQRVVSSFESFIATAPNQWFHFGATPAGVLTKN